jgi:hypothetical protein
MPTGSTFGVLRLPILSSRTSRICSIRGESVVWRCFP